MAKSENTPPPVIFPRLSGFNAEGGHNPWGHLLKDEKSGKSLIVQTPTTGIEKLNTVSVPPKRKIPKLRNRKTPPAKTPPPSVKTPPPEPPKKIKKSDVYKNKTLVNVQVVTNPDALSKEEHERVQETALELGKMREGVRQQCSNETIRAMSLPVCTSLTEGQIMLREAANMGMSFSGYIRWLFFDHAKIAPRPHPERRTLARLAILEQGNLRQSAGKRKKSS